MEEFEIGIDAFSGETYAKKELRYESESEDKIWDFLRIANDYLKANAEEVPRVMVGMESKIGYHFEHATVVLNEAAEEGYGSVQFVAKSEVIDDAVGTFLEGISIKKTDVKATQNPDIMKMPTDLVDLLINIDTL